MKVWKLYLCSPCAPFCLSPFDFWTQKIFISFRKSSKFFSPIKWAQLDILIGAKKFNNIFAKILFCSTHFQKRTNKRGLTVMALLKRQKFGFIIVLASNLVFCGVNVGTPSDEVIWFLLSFVELFIIYLSSCLI